MLSHLMEQIASCAVMDEAYEWLCRTRIDYSANADIWDLRKNWSLIQPQLQRQLLTGEFQFSVQTQHRFSDEIKVVWAAVDSLVLKCITIVLTPFLAPQLSTRCFNIKGNGGLKAAVRETKQAPSEYTHIYRSDILSYYASIRHEILLPQLSAVIPDSRVVSLIAKSLGRVETYGGEYYDITSGISIGSPLSPLLGAIALKPLDDVMEKLDVFYCRYVDDWCIFSKSKYKLRHAIKKMHRVLEQLQMKTHPDKTYIGRREKRFSFLGYLFCNNALEIAKTSIENYQAKRLRLQEQQAPTQRLVDYGRRWLGWFTAGVELAHEYTGIISQQLQAAGQQDALAGAESPG